ncbi:MAG: hypothetical protein M1821_001564 [Bathelium mastoideum]|nr:MAG: hypothetical protein M1821_001564 [Bathelium mastoideum]
MPREAETSLNEREFLLQALREGVRLDGRAFDEFRPLGLSFGEEDGVADVQLGRTRVVVRISCEVTMPFPDRKFDGIFTISTELSPMASAAFEAGRSTEQETLLSRLLEKAIRRSSALDTESLCIVAGSKCFSLRADIHVLDFDGGLVDTCCIALLAALRHYKRPDVSVNGSEVRVWDTRERQPIPLTLLHHPFCVTFGYYTEPEGKEILLLDANLIEGQCSEGEVVLTVNKYGELCQLAKYGGATVDALALLNCARVATEKVKVLDQFVTDKLSEDAKKRDIGGLMAELSAENER